MFEFLKKRINKEEYEERDYTKAYKYFVKTKDGYAQKGIIIYSEHPCYNHVKAIMDVYEKNKEENTN